MVRPLYAVGSDHLLSPYPDELWLMQAMVRPRTGDFLYSEAERNVMLEDMYIFKQSGASGVVFGILRKDGTVDVERVTRSVFPLISDSRWGFRTKGLIRADSLTKHFPCKVRVPCIHQSQGQGASAELVTDKSASTEHLT